jgi:hypothetical protein
MPEPSYLTVLRQKLQQQFANDLKIMFVGGRLTGGVQSQPLGCCWVQAVGELAGRVDEEAIQVGVRVFLQHEQQLDPEVPVDPAPLEDTAAALQQSVRGYQTGIPGIWLQRIVQVTLDPESRMVEAVVLAMTGNAGVV